jgi:glycosyltransferase involved in cell wall biosynthesis
LLLPLPVPVLSWLLNRALVLVPGIRQLCMTWYVVARPNPRLDAKINRSVSIVIPTLNEAGNVEGAFRRIPQMGASVELVFIDGGSTDGTMKAIEQGIRDHAVTFPNARLLRQTGKGKGQAVHQALASCRGEILMILDSDLTMPPEELPKYYEAIATGRGEFVNGCRLVYPMADQAMRFLNMIGNYFFAQVFSWLLGQPVKDTLCGTKVFWRADYEAIIANRSYFGDFDPFGDFDLLFGAARLNRKIIDMPIRYEGRRYGDIKIDRWRHGLLLLKMSMVGFWKLRYRR